MKGPNLKCVFFTLSPAAVNYATMKQQISHVSQFHIHSTSLTDVPSCTIISDRFRMPTNKETTIVKGDKSTTAHPIILVISTPVCCD